MSDTVQQEHDEAQWIMHTWEEVGECFRDAFESILFAHDQFMRRRSDTDGKRREAYEGALELYKEVMECIGRVQDKCDSMRTPLLSARKSYASLAGSDG